MSLFTYFNLLLFFLLTVSGQSALYSEPYEIILQDSHHNHINNIRFNKQGNIFATCSMDNSIKIWSKEGNLLRTITDFFGWVRDVSFSPDGKYIASAAKGGGIYGRNIISMWRVSDGKMMFSYGKGLDSSNCVVFSPKNNVLAAAFNHTIKIFDYSGKIIKSFDVFPGIKGNIEISSIIFTHDGKKLIIAESENSSSRKKYPGANIKIFSDEGKLIKILEGHKSDIRDLVINHDDTLLASISRFSVLKIWDMNGVCIKTIEDCGNGWSISFYNNENTILVSDTEHILLYNINGNLKNKIALGITPNDYCSSISINPGDNTLIAGSHNGSIEVLKPDGKLIIKIDSPLAAYPSDVVWAWDNKLVIAFQPFNIFNNNSSSIILNPDNMSYCKIEHYSEPLAVSPDIQKIALLKKDNHKQVGIFDTNGKLINKFTNGNEVSTLLFSNANEVLVTGNSDGAINFNDLYGNLLMTLHGHSSIVTSLAFTHDGKYLFSGSADGTIKVLDTAIDNISMRDIISGKGLKKHIRTLYNFHLDVDCIQLSPDGEIIIAGINDGRIGILNTKSKNVKIFKKHLYAVNDISFNPDGKTFSTTSDEKFILIWNRAGKVLKKLKLKNSIVTGLEYNNKGNVLIFSTKDGALNFYNLENNRLASLYYCYNTGDWLVVDSTGRYDCSSNAENYIHFVKNMHYYRTSEFPKKFYKKNLLNDYLN